MKLRMAGIGFDRRVVLQCPAAPRCQSKLLPASQTQLDFGGPF